MSILSSLFEKITQEQEQKQSAKSKLMDFEKMIADQARSQGMLPRTYLEQLCQQSESFANSKLVKVLLGERDVPTQKGRDAKPEVLTKRAMNVVKKGIKQAANKQRRRDDKDAVKEDVEQDTQYAKMIIQQNPQEYKKFMQTGDLMDAPTVYEKLFAYFSSSDADDQMPYGTQKARDGDPYVWLTDKLDDLGLTESIHENADQGALKAWYDKYNKYKSADVDNLADGMFKFYRDSGVELDAIEKREYAVLVKKYGEDRITGDAFDYLDDDGITSAMFKEFAQIMGEPASEKSVEKALSMLGLDEGNEFAQKVRQLKAQGAKKGTKFKTSDGEEHTLEDLYAQTIDFMAELEQRIKEQPTITEEEFEELAEKKDACYHKVKARYKVWPSAYASGALVQCRKKGAANWGNKSKK